MWNAAVEALHKLIYASPDFEWRLSVPNSEQRRQRQLPYDSQLFGGCFPFVKAVIVQHLYQLIDAVSTRIDQRFQVALEERYRLLGPCHQRNDGTVRSGRVFTTKILPKGFQFFR